MSLEAYAGVIVAVIFVALALAPWLAGRRAAEPNWDCENNHKPRVAPRAFDEGE